MAGKHTISSNAIFWPGSWTCVCSPHLWPANMAVSTAQVLRRQGGVITAAQLGSWACRPHQGSLTLMLKPAARFLSSLSVPACMHGSHCHRDRPSMALYNDVEVMAGTMLQENTLHDAEPCTLALKPPVQDSMAPEPVVRLPGRPGCLEHPQRRPQCLR